MKNIVTTNMLMLTTDTIICSEREVQERLTEQAVMGQITGDIHNKIVLPYFKVKAQNPDDTIALSILRRRMSTYKLPSYIPSEIRGHVNAKLPSIKTRVLDAIAKDVDQNYSGLSPELRKECYAFHEDQTRKLCAMSERQTYALLEKDAKNRDALATRLKPVEEALMAHLNQAQSALQQKIDAELSARQAAVKEATKK